MNILFVVEHYFPYIGGAEKLFQELAESLVKHGHVVQIVTTQFDSKLPTQEVHRGVNIHRVKCYNRFLFTFFSLPVIKKYAKSANIIHTTTYNAAFPAWLISTILRKPVLITFHEAWGRLWFSLPFISKISKILFYSYEQLITKLGFDYFIAVSDFTKQALINNGIDASKLIRIYNGMNYNEFQHYEHTPPELFTYTYFGRLGSSKGLDLLLPASKVFYDNFPNTKLKLIIPKTPNKIYVKIKNMIEDLRLENHVHLLHELSRKQLYFEVSHSSCVVIPSYSEGFGFVAAESVALGVPIISSQQGALTEVVSGKYIPMERQNTDSLVKALKLAYKSQWNNKPIKKFELSNSVNQYLKLYQSQVPSLIKGEHQNRSV